MPISPAAQQLAQMIAQMQQQAQQTAMAGQLLNQQLFGFRSRARRQWLHHPY
jgi:hypothetical protein